MKLLLSGSLTKREREIMNWHAQQFHHDPEIMHGRAARMGMATYASGSMPLEPAFSAQWPGYPTEPGKLSEAELVAHNSEMHPCGTDTCRQGRGAVCATWCGDFRATQDALSKTWADSGHGLLERTHRTANRRAWVVVAVAVLALLVWVVL